MGSPKGGWACSLRSGWDPVLCEGGWQSGVLAGSGSLCLVSSQSTRACLEGRLGLAALHQGGVNVAFSMGWLLAGSWHGAPWRVHWPPAVGKFRQMLSLAPGRRMTQM